MRLATAGLCTQNGSNQQSSNAVVGTKTSLCRPCPAATYFVKRIPVFALVVLSFVLGDSVVIAQSNIKLDAQLPYTASRSNPVTYDVDFSVVVTPPYKCNKLQVWLPIPVSDHAQVIENSRLSTFPMQVAAQIGTDEVYGNRFAYFEFASPQGGQIIRHQFRITVYQLDWSIDPAKVESVSDWPASFDKFRQGDSQAVIVDERFDRLIDEIVPSRNSPIEDFAKIFDWVQENVKYDHNDASLRADSQQVLLNRRGHCSDYHSFCASLGRAMGVPTRVTYGINTFPKNSPSHCKLEAFLVPYGWVSFDVSETQKLVDLIRHSSDLDDVQKSLLSGQAMERLHKGFRDNTWYLQTRGTDYELVPPASKRVPVVRTAYIEADGVPLPEPDPANSDEQKYSWMTVHEYRANKNVTYPFSDWKSLNESIKAK
jgi:transglutaminase-like putative cysteine protease